MKEGFLISIFGVVVVAFFAGRILQYSTTSKEYDKKVDSLEIVVDSLSRPIIKREEDIDKFIKALAFIESSWNDSIVNPKTDAVGYLQITPIYVDQLNKWGYNYTYEDRFDRYKSIEMFKNTNKILNPEWNLHLALVIHNGRASYAYHQAVFDVYNKLTIDE